MPGNPDYNEKEFLLKIANGDEAAYSSLHYHYYNSLVYFSFGITQNQQQSEDIVLECLIKLWEKPAGFDTLGKLRAYLFTLVRNASFNYLKHLKVREKSQERLSGEENFTDSTIEALLIESDLIRLVYNELDKLEDKYKQVIELLYFKDLPPAEVAHQLGISMDNLRQRKSRALKDIKNELVKKGIDGRLFSFLFF